MHVPGRHPGVCPDLVPGPVLHVHGQVPVLGATLVLIYGPHAQERPEEAYFQQLRAVICALYGRKPPAEVPKAPGQAVLGLFG